jgi:two-component system, NtrC family, sensor kinase
MPTQEPARARRRGALAGAGVAGAAMAAAVIWLGAQEAASPLLAAGLVLVAAAGVALALAYRRGLSALHEAIDSARVGHLAPVKTSRWVRALLGPVVEDYDGMSRDLAALFERMERAQRHIIGERNRHEALLQSLPGAVLIVGTDLQVTRANRQAEALFGRAMVDIVGTPLLQLLGTDSAGEALLREAFGRGEPLRQAHCDATIASARRRLSLNLTFFSQPGEAAAPSAALILQDVTDASRMQELTQQTEKLVALGQMAGGVAHELNTPLGTILGYAHLLTEGRAGTEQRAEYARTIHEQARRCARIIEDLLTYARRPACDAEVTDLNALVRESCEAVSVCQGRRLGVPLELALSATGAVRGSAGQLEIVLVNLVVNAMQAAAANAVTTADPRVQLASRVEGEFAVVTVTDNGPGVAPELRRKIFEPFFTTRPEGGGTGLGLALSHAIVTRVGGMLDCDPAFRGGARLVLHLPLARRSP